MLLVISSYAQKIKRIETKLIASNEEGQNDLYNSADFDEDGKVATVKNSGGNVYLCDKAMSTEILPLQLLAVDLGAAYYPLALKSEWMDGYRMEILGDCQNHTDCQIDMMMDLNQVRLITTTKQEMIEEIFDKFNDPNSKQPSEVVTKHQLSYYPDGSIQQLKYEQIEGDVLTQAFLNQFIYDNTGLLTQYMSADVNSGSRNNFSFTRENGRLIKITWATWNEKKGIWNRPDEAELKYVSDSDMLHSATYINEKGRQQYLQEFIYTYY